MALKYDYNPRTLSILRALDLSSPFSLILEGHQNISNTRDCWHFVKGKINGVFRALRKYSKEYYEDEIGVISDVVFDLIEGYHGITDKSDYLSLQIQLHLRDHVQNKLLKIPIILGWIETICIVAIYFSFLVDVNETLHRTVFYPIILCILAFALFLHTCGVIWQYFVYCNPRSYINPFPSKILDELFTDEQLVLIKYACLMKWMNIVQYNTSTTLLYGLFVIVQKYIVPFVICIAALCVPSGKYDLLFLIVNGIILPCMIWRDVLFRVVKYRRVFWVTFIIQYAFFFGLQVPYWLDLDLRSGSLEELVGALIFCYIILCLLASCFIPKFPFYSANTRFAYPAFVRSCQFIPSASNGKREDIRGTYEIFVCRYLLCYGILQSFFVSFPLFSDGSTAKLVVMTMFKIIAFASIFLYYCAMQIKLLQMYNEKCLSYSKKIWFILVKGVMNMNEQLQFQKTDKYDTKNSFYIYL